MTPAQKALIEKLDRITDALADLTMRIGKIDDIIESLGELTDLLEASFDTQPEIEADPLADHPELPLATEDEAETRWAPVEA
jgi:hypothetical protein